MLKKIIKDLVQEGMKVRAYYQLWLTLSRDAFPDYEDIINQSNYSDFYQTSRVGNYNLIFISLGKIFDTSARTSGIKNLKKALKKTKRTDLESYIEKELGDLEEIQGNVTNIRNKTIVHNQLNLATQQVYEMNDITVNELGCIVEKTCDVINYIAGEYEINPIFKSNRVKRATLNVLGTLKPAKS